MSADKRGGGLDAFHVLWEIVVAVRTVLLFVINAVLPPRL